jgi:uncharacterized protein (TIGR01777 family)
MKILISGSSGLVGLALTKNLERLGHTVVPLVHDDNNSNSKKDLTWSIFYKQVNIKAFENIDCVIHLAGANVAKPWTSKNKQAILDSREQGTKLLCQTILENKLPIKKFISTSAIGFYPDPSAAILTEESTNASSFLGDVCHRWEHEIKPITAGGTELSIVRVGLVLSTKGGVFPVAAKTRKWGVVPITGSKTNYWSWIHLQDLVKIYTALALGELPSGTYNAVAPHAVTQEKFAKSLLLTTKEAKQSFIPLSFMPVVPAFLLKMLLGERSILPLTNQHVSSQKIQDQGFIFDYPTISPAIENLINE